MEHYHVRIVRADLVFSAGHFITFGSDLCERLHGHNYRVGAEVHGPLGENHYVVDFTVLTDLVKGILAALDHRMLLPANHPRIRIVADEREVTATFDDRRWVFPRCDCVLLPVPNTTAELLAGYIGSRLRDELATKTGTPPDLLRIEVDECFGQIAVWEAAAS